jgi:hypothetical protein
MRTLIRENKVKGRLSISMGNLLQMILCHGASNGNIFIHTVIYALNHENCYRYIGY